MANQVDIPLLDEVIWDGILGLAYPNSNLKRLVFIFNLGNQNFNGKRYRSKIID